MNEIVFGRSKDGYDLKVLQRKKGESAIDYVNKASNEISKYMIHFQDENSHRVPWCENWILAILSMTNIRYFRFYEFYFGPRALQRGYGLCSQMSIVAWYFFKKAKIQVNILGFNGHVINQIYDGKGNIHLIDVDYNRKINCTPEKISELAKQVYSGFSQKRIIDLQNIYASNFTIIPNHLLFIKLLFEHLTYFLKWWLPLLFILFFAFV